MTFEDQLISDYLKHGSIESVFKKYKYCLPISFSGYARLLSKRGIVTTAGPNSHLSESLYFFSLLKEYQGTLNKLHKKLQIKISAKTLHRILHNIRLGITRRYGAALILEDKINPGNFLLGQDNSLQGKLGQKGDWSLPMTHTREQDSHYTSILRVLQREVFTNQTINNNFPYQVLNQNLKPIFFINIADIKVFVYHLKINIKKYHYSSYKLSNYQIINISRLQDLKTRPGVKEIVENFNRAELLKNLNSNLNTILQKAYMLK